MLWALLDVFMLTLPCLCFRKSFSRPGVVVSPRFLRHVLVFVGTFLAMCCCALKETTMALQQVFGFEKQAIQPKSWFLAKGSVFFLP